MLMIGAIALSSCDEEPIVFDGQSESQTLVNFSSSSANLGIPLSSSISITVNFEVTSLADADRTFDVVVNETATDAVAGSVSFGSAVVPANSYEGSIQITGTDVGLSPGDLRTFTLDFVESNSVVSDGGLSVTVFLVCESNIPEGNWTAPDGGTVTLVRLDGDRYEFSNFNYGYYAPSNNPIRGIFGDICNILTLEGSTEFGVQWRGTGSYDPNTQTITFSSGVEDANFNPGSFGPPLTFTKQ